MATKDNFAFQGSKQTIQILSGAICIHNQDMELQRLDPENGGASTIVLDEDDEEEIFLGRNPIAQITDTLISRKQASLSHDKKSSRWKLKSLLASKLCYIKKSGSEDWEVVAKDDEVDIVSGDKISLVKDKYIFECKFVDKNILDVKNLPSTTVESEKPKSTNFESEKSKPTIADVDKLPPTNVESEKPKFSSPEKVSKKELEMPSCPSNPNKKRVLPSWMMDLDDEGSAKKSKKDSKTPSKQVSIFKTSCLNEFHQSYKSFYQLIMFKTQT